MNIWMVIIICFGTSCEAIWEQTTYNTIESCVTASKPVSQYMQNQFPTSAGEIHCMTDGMFETFKQGLRNGKKPTLSTEPAQTSI
jgi:hypothetical protein